MSKVKTALSILFVRLRFILVFVVIGLIVGNWDFITNVVGKLTRPSKASDLVSGEFEWYCPMHPSVVRNDPSEKCPICGMPLSKRKKGEKPKMPAGVLQVLTLTPTRVEQAGIATEEVTFRTLVREVRTVGFIEYDERRLAHITARTAGRVDKLYVDFTGTTVKRGDRLVWIYSPDLVTTLEEYLLAVRALEQIKTRGGDSGAVERAQRTVDSARERLRLWGITDQQIKKLEESKKVETHLEILSPIDGTVISKHVLAGQYVQEGTELYQIADLSHVWMQAEVFERDIGLIKEGQAVEMTSEAYPGEAFHGKVTFIHPTLQTETRTVKVRMDVHNKDGRLKPGMNVRATLRIPIGRQGEIFYGC